MLPHLGFPELLLILLVVVLLFGVNRLPRLGRGLGEGIRNFRDSLRAGRDGGAPGDDRDGAGTDDNGPPR